MTNIIRTVIIIVVVGIIFLWLAYPPELKSESQAHIVQQEDMGNGVICYYAARDLSNPNLFCVKVR